MQRHKLSPTANLSTKSTVQRLSRRPFQSKRSHSPRYNNKSSSNDERSQNNHGNRGNRRSDQSSQYSSSDRPSYRSSQSHNSDQPSHYRSEQSHQRRRFDQSYHSDRSHRSDRSDQSSEFQSRERTHRQRPSHQDQNDNQPTSRQQSQAPRQPKFLPPVSIGQQLTTIMIEDMTSEGQGVGKVDNFPIFIPNAIPGEVVDITITGMKQSYSTGTVTSWSHKSPFRTTPLCKHFSACGGCQLQHMTYEGQLEWKHKMVSNIIERIGKLDHMPIIKPVKGMANPWHYRNKAQVQVGTDIFSRKQTDSFITGFYAPRSHTVVDINECLISSPELTPILTTFTNCLNELGIRPYDEISHTGDLRNIVLRKGQRSGELMVILVSRIPHLPHTAQIVATLRQLIPQLTSIQLNINPARTNVILGAKSSILWGEETITDSIGDIKFEISPSSFYQVNPVQTEVLYAAVMDFANKDDKLVNSVAVDAYCGVGTIGLYLAKSARHVVGIEVLSEAIDNAKANARSSDLYNKTSWYVGKSEEVLHNLYMDGLRPGLIVVDPPRSGLEEQLIHSIGARQTPRVVYVSCNPATLGRDLKRFEAFGYKTKEIQPVDMFPQTHHLESVAWLEFDPATSPSPVM